MPLLYLLSLALSIGSFFACIGPAAVATQASINQSPRIYMYQFSDHSCVQIVEESETRREKEKEKKTTSAALLVYG
jgi:hypothetical protein